MNELIQKLRDAEAQARSPAMQKIVYYAGKEATSAHSNRTPEYRADAATTQRLERLTDPSDVLTQKVLLHERFTGLTCNDIMKHMKQANLNGPDFFDPTRPPTL